MRRGRKLIIVGLLAGVGLTAACAPTTRYRVLSFFFDGVPEPGAKPRKASAAEEKLIIPIAQPMKKEVFAHAPYRGNLCRECHDPTGSWLEMTVEAGLCEKCHAAFEESRPLVHRPAADRNCLACHSPHESAYPGVLTRSPETLCDDCHRREDLNCGPHHETLSSDPCLSCHDPHGGADPFFLRQPVP
ncbi:MAG: hypothetical protein HZB38_01130 [Planctomycetes bacterium]|nr:hypothetical protein [Planctomycetota bacterium]